MKVWHGTAPGLFVDALKPLILFALMLMIPLLIALIGKRRESEGDAPPLPRPPPSSEAVNKTCPGCGTANATYSTFCRQCGQHL